MVGSPLDGLGSALQGATALAQYVLGVNTSSTTNSNGTTDSSSHADTTVTSDNKTKSETATSIDPDIFAMFKSMAVTADNNSKNPVQAQGLISGILQQAMDTMTSIFGRGNQSGLYNSDAVKTQNNDVMSRATALASQAVLNYQTGQQNIEADVLAKAGAASTKTTTNTDSLDTATTHVTGGSHTDVKSSSYTSGHSGMSIICTYLFEQKRIKPAHYVINIKDFDKKPWYIREGYLTLSRPLLKMIKKNPTSLFSRSICWIFLRRTEAICAKYKYKNVKPSFSGHFARALVATVCFFPCLMYLIQDKLAIKLSPTDTWS